MLWVTDYCSELLHRVIARGCTCMRGVTLASRLNEVNLAIVDAGFASLTDVLINEINCFSDRGALRKRAVAFYKHGDCSKLIAAVIGNKRFTSQGHPVLIRRYHEPSFEPRNPGSVNFLGPTLHHSGVFTPTYHGILSQSFS